MPDGTANGHSGPSNPLLFPRSYEPWDQALWNSPTSEYRGAPFWSWNNRLSAETLIRQLDFMREKMGMGGAHMHPRTGLETPYMGKEYMGIMKQVVERCKETGMLACLYDEDRWPSGAAGGMVTKTNPDFAATHLLITTYPYGQLPDELKLKNPSKGQTQRSENGHLLASFQISLSPDGVVSYTRSTDPAHAQGNGKIWHFYAERQPAEPWWNYGTYIDTLSPEAVKLFIQLTHERYAEAFKEEFGSTIPSIFTDEPQSTRKMALDTSTSTNDLFLPWTPSFSSSFSETYGADIIDHLPSLIWDTADSTLTRYRYHNHICELFVRAFLDQVASWCRDRNINLTGHMNGEPLLSTQSQYLGEAMRCYRNFDLPGIDILVDEREWNTAKQASSVARQNGVKGLMSELYGVTNWTWDFKGHKGQGDWQAALGVTFRVPHLFPVSMKGEAKRDYPAAIGYQSPWATEYSYIEDHFARVTVAMTRGRPITRVAVIHPIESFWLFWGPADRNGAEQVWREKAFKDLTDWLLRGLIDFDFIAESLFAAQTPLEGITGQQLSVGKCKYDVVVLANLYTIRQSTLERVQRFAKEGGRAIVAGQHPSLIDASPAKVSLNAEEVAFTQWDLLKALETHRDVKITAGGKDVKSLVYQLRQDGDEQFLFVCDTERHKPISTRVRVRGEWDVTLLDTLLGTSTSVESQVEGGWTCWDWTFYGSGSMLVHLTPRSSASSASGGAQVEDWENGWNEQSRVTLDRVELSEPNVLLLDQAEWKIGESGKWQPKLEVLKIDNAARSILGLPLKKDAFPQPWTASPEDRVPKNTLFLRYIFTSDADIPTTELALEDAETTTVRLDGTLLPGKRIGWWVDEDISRIELGAIGKGKHTLELQIPFGRFSNVERIYILGRFSVSLSGTSGVLGPLDLQRIGFGDFTRQGLPFYVGNVTYHISWTVPSQQHTILQTYRFEGPAVTFSWKGHSQNISLPPHIADLGELTQGKYEASLTLYGNRENAFGALHMPPGMVNYWGPNSWRGDQAYHMDEYDIKQMGIMTAPAVAIKGKRTLSVPQYPWHATS